VTLTEDVIYFGKIGTGELLDYIPLLEIKQESLFVSSDSKHHRGWNFTRTSQGMRVLSTEDCAKSVSPNVHGGGRCVSQCPQSAGDLFGLASITLEYEESLTFVLQTTGDDHNSGRSIILEAKDEADKLEWKTMILRAIQQALETQKNLLVPGFFARMQVKLRKIYTSKLSEFFFAAIIMATYVTAIVQYQFLPQPDSALGIVRNKLEIFFTIIFAIELMVNLAGNWWRPFARDMWNWMDASVVAISIAGVVKES